MSTGEDPVLHAIFSRRVTRSMTSEPIGAEELDTVVRAGGAAPNAGNRRLQPIVAVTDSALLALIRLVAPGMIARPRALVVISVDHARADAFGFPPGMPGLYIDVGTAMATMLLAAKALGLGAVPVSSFSRVAVGRLLALPETTEPRMLVCLGHAAPKQPPAMPAPSPTQGRDGGPIAEG